MNCSNHKIRLIIPCCGEGKRFVDAGYNIYKPALPFLGKPLLHHIIDAFGQQCAITVITDHAHYSIVSELCMPYPDAEIICIAGHKNGATYSLLQAAHKLRHNQACFVAYNDVFWKWDIARVLQFIDENRPDGVVFTHTGFHPHIVGNNFSAFVKIDGNSMLAIQEKGSFTDNFIDEPVSTGVYYFGNTGLMLSLAEEMVNNNERVAGEFYPSMLFNKLVAMQQKVMVYETKPFVHLGTPEQYEDALSWQGILGMQNTGHNLPSLIMMCGTGSRMQYVSDTNKAGIEVKGIAMWKFIANKMACNNVVTLVNQHTSHLVDDATRVIDIGTQTASQTESLQKAIPFLNNFAELLVLSNDCYGFFDPSILKLGANNRVTVFGFVPRLMHRKQGNAHTGISVNNAVVTEISIKSINNSQMGFAGMVYFRDMDMLREILNIDSKLNPSIDHFIKHLLSNNYEIHCVLLKEYVHLGTPEEYREYVFWSEFYHA